MSRLIAGLLIVLSLAWAGSAFAQKQGGVLHVTHRDNPPSASIWEEATISTDMPFMAVFNNLVVFDPDSPQNRLDRIVPPDAKVEVLAGGGATFEGPVWIEEDSTLAFSEVGIAIAETGFTPVNDGRRWRWDPTTRAAAVIEEPTGRANGMTRDRQGRLLMCEFLGERVSRLEAHGGRTVIAGDYRGQPLKAPNDIVCKSDGAIYFTNSADGCTYRAAPDLKSIDRVADSFRLANGLAFSPDETILYINDSQGVTAVADTFHSQGSIRAYDVGAEGMLSNSRLFAELLGERSGIPDGMKADSAGNVYCTGPGGVWVFDPDGTHLGTILTDVRHNVNNPTNMAWGGPDWRTLYITTTSTLLSVDLLVPGVAVRRGNG